MMFGLEDDTSSTDSADDLNATDATNNPTNTGDRFMAAYFVKKKAASRARISFALFIAQIDHDRKGLICFVLDPHYETHPFESNASVRRYQVIDW